MLLCVDVGNTQTVLGVYEGGHLRVMWRISSEAHRSADEIKLHVKGLFSLDEIDCRHVESAVLSCVVPPLSGAWTDALNSLFAHKTLICNARTVPEQLFKTTYPRKEEIGADRVADAIAARYMFGEPVVVVDFGTATNIEVIDKQGYFVGGIIAPGVNTSADALFAHARKLSSTELFAPDQPIGCNSADAIRSGIVFGEAEKVSGLVARVFQQLGYSSHIVATGGLADVVVPHMRQHVAVCPYLTLEGMRIFHDSVTRASK